MAELFLFSRAAALSHFIVAMWIFLKNTRIYFEVPLAKINSTEDKISSLSFNTRTRTPFLEFI